MSEERHILVVGGGIVGLACAHYLRKDGCRVTVVDKGRIGGECSHGNCGFVSPSHVLPLAEPGAIGTGISALLRRNGALRIRPRLDANLWRWLLRFAKRCNREAMLQSAGAIHPLLRSSMLLYEELVRERVIDCEWQKRGMLFVYKTRAAFDNYRPTNDLLTREFNEPAQPLTGAELSEFEPALQENLAGAWYFENDAHLRPDKLLSTWRATLEQSGVTFLEQHTLERFGEEGGEVHTAITGGRQVQADAFVVATGARTPLLADTLKRRIPIEPGKGYSITLPRPQTCPTHPMIFPERRVAVTPLESSLRLGSTMEFAGYDERIRTERLSLLTNGAAEYLRDFKDDGSFPDRWFGWRPMTYDSFPVIGRLPDFRNVYVATGHNMLGVSMAPATGRLISELINGRQTHLASAPYAVDRF